MQYLIQILLALTLATQNAPPPATLTTTASATATSPVDQVPVLMYHHMVPQSELASEEGNLMVVSVEQFAEQMGWLKNEGWQTISSQELASFIKSGTPVPPKSFVITFDDGYTSNYLYAAPILKTVNFKAIVFVITDHMRDTERLYGGKKMSWIDLKGITNTFEIHNHTHFFHKQRNGRPYLLIEGYEAVYKDIETAYTIIEGNLPKNPRVFAAPYGSYNGATLRALTALKTDLAFSTKEGYATRQSAYLEVPRFYVTPETSMADFKKIFENVKSRANIVPTTDK